MTTWLGGLPALTIFLVVGGIILLESMGIPLPGEITLISASLLAATGATNIWGVAIAASIGAIVGDSIGYAIGRRGGRPLLERFGRRFPKHFGPSHLARAERIFAKWGVWAVFFGRFVALLRILAGPLAGALHVPYRKFLIANAAGGIVWAFGTAFVIYFARPGGREVPQGLLLDRAGRRHRVRHRHHGLPAPPGRPGGRAAERRRPDHQPVTGGRDRRGGGDSLDDAARTVAAAAKARRAAPGQAQANHGRRGTTLWQHGQDMPPGRVPSTSRRAAPTTARPKPRHG